MSRIGAGDIAASVEPYSVLDPAHAPGGIHGDYIEAHTFPTPFGMFTQQDFRRAQKARLLAWPQCRRGIGQGAARLDFDKDGQTLPFCNSINLARRRAHAPAKYGKPIALQGSAGETLSFQSDGGVCHGCGRRPGGVKSIASKG